MDIQLKDRDVSRAIEETGENELRVDITIGPDVVQRELERTFDNIQDQVEVPGFRKGKAPIQVIKKKYGEMVREDLQKRLIDKSLQLTLEDVDEEIVGEPELSEAPPELQEDEPFAFRLNLETKPDVEVGNYDEIEVEKPGVEVTEEDLDEALESTRREYAELNWVEEGTVEEDDLVIADATLSVDGELQEEGENVEMSINEQFQLFGLSHPSLWQHFVGLETGASHQVRLDLPDDEMLRPDEFRGDTATVHLTIHEMKRPELPELNDTFAERFNCDSVEELRSEVREQVRGQKEQNQEEQLHQDILDTLVERADFEIPDRLLEKGQEQFLHQQQQRMAQAGLPREAIQEQIEQGRDEARESVRQNMKRQYVIKEVAEREKIYVTESEIDEYLKELAGQQDMWPHELREQLEENDQMDSVRSDLKEQKVMDFLLERVSIEDTDEE